MSSYVRKLTLQGTRRWANTTLLHLPAFPAIDSLHVEIAAGPDIMSVSASRTMHGLLPKLVTLFIHNTDFNHIHDLQVLVSLAPCLKRLSVILDQHDINSWYGLEKSSLHSAPTCIEDLSLRIYHSAVQNKLLDWIPHGRIKFLRLEHMYSFESPVTIEYVRSLGASLLHARIWLPHPNGTPFQDLHSIDSD